MATYTTYTTLVSDVQNFIQRGGSNASDPVVFAQIPRLINAAERKLALMLKIQGIITPIVDLTGLQQGNPVVTKPDRWRQTVSLNFGTGTGNNTRLPLFPRSYEYCRSFWPDDTATGIPAFYADWDYQHWLIAPTPDQTYPLEVVAYLLPVLLDSNNQSNFWSEFAPNALLYGTLLEAMPFLGKDDRVEIWRSYWQQELAALDGMDLQKIMDRASQRTKA